ncbi:hypothetical protein ABZ816_38220 [Actinosynnema sp. NPDC047251]|uniref:Uncharacterized protein n=1 Tax=Saccharothrix espanaensis (strain ATCC 51144 / DSM 44229 / JCM 9112 / NBRC 15066 / NRRL 15764) TaxID=1179773 RepID=K0K0T3_SACES|nr:hypothetical protein [Saccharothrix espanaensis]CCH30163.1 hypothetical protein BN6_28540 [Saccharothrix espanaensis DSM 44229]
MNRVSNRPPDDVELLRCFQVLDLRTVPARFLAAGAALDPDLLDHVAARRSETASGLVRIAEGEFGWYPDPPLLPLPWDDSAELVTRRVGEDLLAALGSACALLGRPVDGFEPLAATAAATTAPPAVPPIGFTDRPQATSWLRRHLTVSLAAVRAAGRARLRSLATALAAHLWTCAPTDVPRQWAEGLADAGTRAAIDDRQPRRLAGLLRLSARWFAASGDFVTANAHGVREWTVWKELGDTAGMIDTLWRRAEIYRADRRGNRELDCYQRLRSLYQGVDDRFGLARTQVARGVALIVVGRPRNAGEQLRDAARAVEDLADVPPSDLASLLETLGRAFWRLGAVGTAKRQFSGALRLLVDHDDQAAQRIRALLAHPEHLPLPGHGIG